MVGWRKKENITFIMSLQSNHDIAHAISLAFIHTGHIDLAKRMNHSRFFTHSAHSHIKYSLFFSLFLYLIYIKKLKSHSLKMTYFSSNKLTLFLFPCVSMHGGACRHTCGWYEHRIVQGNV